MKLQQLALIFALLLFISGLGIQQYVKQQTVPFTQVMAKNVPLENPSRIIINSANIDLKVMPGGLVGDKWILSDTYAHVMKQNGNTIIYAHKRAKLFGTLKEVKKNDRITLMDHRGLSTKYKIYDVEDIKPTDVDKVYAGDKNTLTLFTCDGAFDDSRLMVKAKAE